MHALARRLATSADDVPMPSTSSHLPAVTAFSSSGASPMISGKLTSSAQLGLRISVS
jgi:hypothetical protein